MKAEVDKLDINDPTGLINLKSKVDDLDINKWETVPDLVSKEVLKKTVYNKLNGKVNLENKIPDATTLIYIN